MIIYGINSTMPEITIDYEGKKYILSSLVINNGEIVRGIEVTNRNESITTLINGNIEWPDLTEPDHCTDWQESPKACNCSKPKKPKKNT